MQWDSKTAPNYHLRWPWQVIGVREKEPRGETETGVGGNISPGTARQVRSGEIRYTRPGTAISDKVT